MQTKLKICSVCQDPCRLWVSHPPMCKNCAKLAKLAEKKEHKPLVQTEDGKVAKIFKYQTKAIKKVSTRQQKLNAQYEKLRGPFLQANTLCQASLQGCMILSDQVHHKRGRGEYFLRVDTWMPVCGNCHTWINEHNEAATALGYCQSRLAKVI